MTTSNSKRFSLIDQIRGFAVVLMIIFHFCYDLNVLKYVSIDFSSKTPFWYYFPRVIVFLFLTSVGLSLPLSHYPEIKWKKFWKRFLKIAFFAICISVSTKILFPKYWIYFGTLHCIALCSLFALPFLKYPIISGIIGLIMAALKIFFGLSLPWIKMEHLSMDYIPVFPWISVVFMAIYASHKGWHKFDLLGKNKASSFLGLLGKHSLVIYVLHQPIMYGLLLGLKLTVFK